MDGWHHPQGASIPPIPPRSEQAVGDRRHQLATSCRSLAHPFGTLVVLGLVCTVLVLTSGSRDNWHSEGLLTTIVATGFAARAAWLTTGAMSFSWSMLGIYLAIYGMAEALYTGLLTGTPHEGAGDIVFFIAFVPAGLGLLFYPILQMVRGAMWGPLLIDAAVLVISVSFATYTLVLRQAYESDLPALDLVLLSIYPLISAWCAALMLLVLARSTGASRPDAVLLGLAYVIFSWADNGYVFLTTQGAELTGTWADVGYTLAPLLLAASAATAVRVPTPRRALRRHLPGSVKPVLADLFGLGALALAALIGNGDQVSIVLGIATVITLGIRQVTMTHSSWQLRGALEQRIDERNQEMVELTAHYERLDALKREFITAASHELRTPLAAIRGALEMLEDGDAGQLPPRAHRVVSIATRGSERLSRLVNDIIDLEKLDGGVFVTNPTVQPVREMVAEAVQTLSPLAAQQDIELFFELDQTYAWCESDPIVQVLINLLGNALKFSERGTRVTIECRRQGGEVVLSVRDQGRGIPPDQLETVFARFHQIEEDDSRQLGGAGLGLSISQLIVHNHGGRIWAESDGNGSTFWFTLPAADPTGHTSARKVRGMAVAP